MRQPASWKHVFSIAFQSLIVFGAGLFLFVFLWMISILSTQIWFAGRVMPGVHMAGVNLTGYSIEETASALQADKGLLSLTQMSLVYRDQVFPVNAEDLGIKLDLSASTQKAYSFGRSGSPGTFFAYHMLGRYTVHNLLPVIEFNQLVSLEYLAEIKKAVDQPMIDSSLQLEGIDVVATKGQTGRSLDIAASIDSIGFHLQRGEFENIPLVVHERHPEIADAALFAGPVEEILDKPFTFQIPDEVVKNQRDFRINELNLSAMLTIIRETEGGQISLIPQFNENLLTELLIEIASEVNTDSRNARFIFNDDTRELDLLAGAATGYELEIQSSLDRAQDAIRNGASSTELVFNSIQPAVDNQTTADDLSISELIQSESSYFFGSSPARIQNIETAAGEFHGLLVPPGDIFSMSEVMREVSLDSGYTEALIIYNGKTIEGVGGGVCQVSTTLFRTAFFAGFPIQERYPHAYRVSYYEKTAGNGRDENLAGLDATVYVPIVDLKFVNDSNHWLLMETYVSRANSRLTWKFYSTSDGRTVDWQTSGPVNTIEPKKPLYQLNPDLDAGEIKQVDWEAEGADILVNRTVIRNSEELFKDSFFTQYSPWRAIYEYGPGTDGIPDN